MEFLQQWARGLIALVVLMGLVEMALPADSMKPYVRMVLGLLIIIALVRPVLHELPGLRSWEPALKAASEEGVGELTEMGREIRERGRIAAEQVVRESTDLESYVHQRLPESSNARIRQDGTRIRVQLTRETPDWVGEKITALLLGLGWERAQIEVDRDA